MWRSGVIDCNFVQCSLVIDTQPCLQLTYLHTDDDYCACRPRQCRVKAVGGRGLRGIHILGTPHFSEQGPSLE